jgi:chromosome segregation ATPase
MLKKLPLLLFLLITGLPLPSSAAEESATAEIISLEIRNLSTSVDRLTELLYSQAQQNSQQTILRKLDIAVAYLNFRSRRIEQLERDKQRSTTAKNRFEDIIRQWEQRIEQIEEQTGNNKDRLSKQEAQEQLKMLKQRLTRVDSELLEYDNKIIELQSQLDSVEDFVERHLELE